MFGPKGNSEFSFPETLEILRYEAEANIEVQIEIESNRKMYFSCGYNMNNYSLGKTTTRP